MFEGSAGCASWQSPRWCPAALLQPTWHTCPKDSLQALNTYPMHHKLLLTIQVASKAAAAACAVLLPCWLLLPPAHQRLHQTAPQAGHHQQSLGHHRAPTPAGRHVTSQAGALCVVGAGTLCAHKYGVDAGDHSAREHVFQSGVLHSRRGLAQHMAAELVQSLTERLTGDNAMGQVSLLIPPDCLAHNQEKSGEIPAPSHRRLSPLVAHGQATWGGSTGECISLSHSSITPSNTCLGFDAHHCPAAPSPSCRLGCGHTPICPWTAACRSSCRGCSQSMRPSPAA